MARQLIRHLILGSALASALWLSGCAATESSKDELVPLKVMPDNPVRPVPSS